MNCPMLWARLQISETNFRSFIDPSNNRFDSYMSTCMARKKGQQIIVDLNFSLLPEPQQFIAETLGTLPYFQEWIEDRYILASSFRDLDWSQFEESGYFSRLQDGIHRLANLDNYIKIYKSLDIVLPSSGNIGHAILDSLNDIGLQPSSLNIPYYFDLEWQEIIVEDDPFGNLSDVEALITYDLTRSLKLGIYASNIQHLELTFDETYRDIIELSRLTSLLTLTLHGSLQVEDMPPVSIVLPTLKKISLNGYVTSFCNLDWNLPVLEEFALCEHGIPAVIPHISALNLQLIGKDTYIDISDTEKHSRLSVMMDLSPSVQTLTIPSRWRTAAIRAIAQHHLEYKLTSLYKLVVVGKGKAPEELYMLDLAPIAE